MQYLKTHKWLPAAVQYGSDLYNYASSMPWTRNSKKSSRSAPPKTFTSTSRRSRRGSVKTRTRKFTKKRKFGKKRKYSVKKQLWTVKKKLRRMPLPRPVLYMDAMKLQYKVPQGSILYTGLGGFATQSLATPFNFTSSATDPSLLLSGPVNNSGSTNTLGRCRTCINSWKQATKMTNIDNSPVKVTQIILYCKSSVPAVRDLAQAKALATGAGTLSNPTAAAASFEGWLSEAMQAQYQMISGVFTPLSTLNPNQTAGPDNLCATNVPGFELQDSGVFNKHFKVARRSTRTIQPGESTEFVFGSKRPLTINEETYWDALDTGAGTNFGLKFLAWKGWRYQIFKMESIPVSAAAGGTASVTLGDSFLNIVSTYRYRVSFISQDGSKAYNYAALPANTSEKLIYPGTSTATAQAPAI